MKSESERQTQLRSEAERKLREAETQLKSIQAKSKQLIKGMQSQLEEQSKARESRPTATFSLSDGRSERSLRDNRDVETSQFTTKHERI